MHLDGFRPSVACNYYTTGHDDIEEDEEDEFTDGSVHVHYDR